MINTKTTPDYIFESSWEVCNKVGGIYTVLSTKAHTLQQMRKDKVIFIGPDIWQTAVPIDFIEDDSLFDDWKRHADLTENLHVKVGRWNVPGMPPVMLVDFKPFLSEKDAIYYSMWEHFHVNSLHAYGDYDEASMWAYASGRVVETIVQKCLKKDASVVLQAHEWLSAMGLLHVKGTCPSVATVFSFCEAGAVQPMAVQRQSPPKSPFNSFIIV